MNKQPVYSPGQAALGSFLGGPLASVVFVRRNFQALGNSEAEKKTLLFGAILLLALLGLLPFLPDRFPNMAFPIATIVATRAIVEKYQFTKQAIAESTSLAFQSNWRVFFVALLCLVVFFAVAMAVVFGFDYFGIVEIA